MKPITASLALLLALSPQAQAAADGNSRFGFELYQRLAAKPGNLFFSPYSISTALAMTSAGARGPTLAEMLGTLHLGADPHGAMKELREAIASDGKNKPLLVTANRLWAQAGAPYLPDYLALTEKDYGATLGQLDFQADPEAARRTINDWVSEQTRKKIADLMPKGSIQKTTDLVLTNAIYFKGDWQSPFNKSETRDEDFTPASGEAAKHAFMHQKAHFAYAEDDKFQALRLPYKGGALAMTILLPKAGAGGKTAITAAAYAKLTQRLAGQEVIVTLPKFRLEHEERLEHVLPAMGMKLAFTPDADFSGMRALKPGDQLYISVVAHKAFVDVDETGTEAAAATGVGMVFASAILAPKPPKVFNANHPFLFLIEHLPSQSLLFLGRVEMVSGTFW